MRLNTTVVPLTVDTIYPLYNMAGDSYGPYLLDEIPEEKMREWRNNWNKYFNDSETQKYFDKLIKDMKIYQYIPQSQVQYTEEDLKEIQEASNTLQETYKRVYERAIKRAKDIQSDKTAKEIAILEQQKEELEKQINKLKNSI